jgi:signal transduction histidine kinase
MLEKEIEPGLLRIFRYFTGLAVIYFLAFFFYTSYTAGTWISPNLFLYYINFSTYLFLLLYLSWGWLKNHLKQYYLPIAIMVSGIVPIITSFLLWPMEPGDSFTQVIIRSWTLIPILIVPVVLIAWQYGYTAMIAFVILTFLYDLPFILFSIDGINLETMPALGVPFIRSLAFGTVGHIVHMLMETQRAQRKKLIQANLQLAEHATTLEQLATSRERNRLARELHDTLAHTLSGQIVTLEALKLDLNKDDQTFETINHLLETARTGLTETRRALKDLRSQQLEDLGFSIALTNLVQDAAARANAEPSIHIQNNLPHITQELEQCIFRISQEALENIVRHSDAAKIEMQVFYKTPDLWVKISDDGKGFSKSILKRNNSLGIKGMKERAQEFGGQLTLSSVPTQGTTLEAKFEVNYDKSFNL